MARPSLQAVGQNALGSFQRMTGPQRVTLGLAFAATAIGIFLVARATSSVPMTTLYADLDPEVAAEVTSALDARGVPYELEAGGRLIRVPAAEVHSVRLDLAADDLPSGSGGWEIVENQSVTASATVIDVAIVRAMQDELARTISSIDTVRSANVHLVMPEDDLFADDDRHPSAAILVDTGGETLGPMQVQAIVNLTASAVEGLQADQVSLADETGRVLAAPGGDATTLDLAGDYRFRTRLEFEQSLEGKVEAMLANVVGPGLAIVEVTADLDFDAETVTSEENTAVETADGEQAVSNEILRNELYRDQVPVATEGGELEIELPDEELVDDDGNAEVDEGVIYLDQERQRDALVNRVTTTRQSAPGSISSLSVAVLLDETEVDEARVDEIEGLVGAAVGLNENRGDVMSVTLLPFNDDVRTSLEEAVDEVDTGGGGLDLVALIRTAGTVVVALIVLLLAIRNLSRNPRRRVIESVELNELESGVAAALEAGSTDQADEESHGEPPEQRLQHLIANQTDDVAGVLRSWLNEGEQVPG
jgi:flagellar M-ring protein FliF